MKGLIERATYTLLRTVSGLVLLHSGGSKMFGWFGGMPAGVKLDVGSQMWIGGILEVAGGVLLMLGFLTRPVAFLVSGMMAVAYFQFHQPSGTWPVQNGGVPAALLCFIFLYIAARGAGVWSLDALIRGREDRQSTVLDSYSIPDPEE